MKFKRRYQRPQALGPTIGRFMDADIRAWIRLDDGDYAYVGLAPGSQPGLVDIRQLGEDEVAIPPGLLYRRQVGVSKTRDCETRQGRSQTPLF